MGAGGSKNSSAQTDPTTVTRWGGHGGGLGDFATDASAWPAVRPRRRNRFGATDLTATMWFQNANGASLNKEPAQQSGRPKA
jgi:hypothetical protein